MEEIAFEYVDGDQAVPLLKTEDKTLHLGKNIRTLTNVLRSVIAFKAHAASAAGAHVHHDNSGAAERVSSCCHSNKYMRVCVCRLSINSLINLNSIVSFLNI